jgi:hypothetical protein
MKSKFKDIETAVKLDRSLKVAMMFASELAGAEQKSGAPFEVHKSINVLYKELRAQEIFIRALLEGSSKKSLRDTHVEIIKPQSWRFYTKEKLDV